MKILESEIILGAELPFSIIHVSDTHLTRTDERNDERKRELAEVRSKIFPEAESCLKEITAYANKNQLPIVHTGDLIDFVSYANLDAAKKFVYENDVLFSAGNHEFSLYVGEAFEDKAYREQSLDLVQSVFKNNIRFDTRIINGVKLVCIDNSYYRFEAEQLEALKKEVSEGLPILLFLHCPLHEKALYDLQMQLTHSASICTTPEELMKNYPEKRYIQQKADDITVEATEYIKKQTLIEAIFTGHLHYDYENQLCPGMMQYVTGMTTIRKITIK